MSTLTIAIPYNHSLIENLSSCSILQPCRYTYSQATINEYSRGERARSFFLE